MSDDQGLLALDYQEQFRAVRLQVHDWGTFSGLHDIPLSPEGHLIVGNSGSGKSTLLDAFSALLMPKRWYDFNAAAREQEKRSRDRSLLTYARGAWSTQQDLESGGLAVQFLRPGSTWSSLALSFSTGRGQTVTLVLILWIRGKSVQENDVHRQYMIFERPFSLKELSDFDMDVRRLKKKFPEVLSEGEFSPYQERFMRLLGIDGESALRLLHKTQSAKNLGDLNAFLRDYMLDVPETFQKADDLVTDFQELDGAHRSVKKAEAMIQILSGARTSLNLREQLMHKAAALQVLQTATGFWVRVQKSRLHRETVEGAKAARNAARLRLQGLDELLHSGEESLSAAQEAFLREGGGQWESLIREKSFLENQRSFRDGKFRQLEKFCRGLGVEVPKTPEAFETLLLAARSQLEDLSVQEMTAGSGRKNRDTLVERCRHLRGDLQTVERELDAMKDQSSNVPAEFLARRRNLASACHIPESRLPFVGELLDVIEGEEDWRGSIERVLRGFALSLLVGADDHGVVSRYVNDVHLGYRLVYQKVDEVTGGMVRRPEKKSLRAKLRLREGRWQAWLELEMEKRFEYLCVDSVKDLAASTYALTRNGLIRQGGSRHEKDDRRGVDDRDAWVLGFQNKDRQERFTHRAGVIHKELRQCEEELKALEQAEDSRLSKMRILAPLAEMSWSETDLSGLLSQIARLEKDTAAVMDPASAAGVMKLRVDELKRQCAAASDARDQANQQVGAGEHDLVQALANQEVWEKSTKDLPGETDESDPVWREAANLFLSRKSVLTLANIDQVLGEVRDNLSQNGKTLELEALRAEKSATQAFRDFRKSFPAESADLVDETLESARDYLLRLDKLEIDDLPKFKDRFFDLLQKQTHQQLTGLTHLTERTRRGIKDRMTLVNESLAKSPFGEGTWLFIEVMDRKLTDVTEFYRTVRTIQENALQSDQASAELRFELVRSLVKKLSSEAPEDQRWRTTILDVRLHVEFVAVEKDGQGREVESYRSGAGKSGGQRQKLATTCLAAALRYQLGGLKYGQPRFAMVVMDEAFDKADHDFTAKVMEIFEKSGFQMIMATPNKATMSLEPYIGGATYITIKDRNRSGCLQLEYDPALSRLGLLGSSRPDEFHEEP